MKNLFIVFDGIDGSGKSTQLELVHNYLFSKDKRIRVVSTREPTFGVHGEKIRKILQTQKDPFSDSELLLDLYVEDRRDHVENLILPFLKESGQNQNIILCDRYYYSTIAYQAAQGIDQKKIIDKNKEFPKPDLAFIFHVPAEVALSRIAQERSIEKFEKKEFMNKLEKEFEQLSEVLEDNIVPIDSSEDMQETFAQIKKKIDEFTH